MTTIQALPKLSDGDLWLDAVFIELHPVHKCQTYFFQMVNASSGEAIGTINLRLGGGAHIELYAGHIGYLVEAEYLWPRTPPEPYASLEVWLTLSEWTRSGSLVIRRTSPLDTSASGPVLSSKRASMYLPIARFIRKAIPESAATDCLL